QTNVTAEGTTYTPASGLMRLWTKNGNEARNPASILDGGDFVPHNTDIPIELLFGAGSLTNRFYVEGIAPCDSQAGTISLQLHYPSRTRNLDGITTITAEAVAYHDDTQPYTHDSIADMVRVSLLKVELKSISFIDAGAGNGGDNEHTLYENADPAEWGDGAAIADPVWVADGPDAGSDPDKNSPVCYTRSTATAQSKASVDVVLKVQPAGQMFNLIAIDGATEYFRKDGITSTGGDQTVASIVASVALPTTLEKLSKTLTWKAVFTSPHPDVECQAGESTHTIYTVYDAPITTIEGQDNKPTSKRLDFAIVGVAAGQSGKVTICDKIVEHIAGMIGDAFDSEIENPRWQFYARTPVRALDCDHRGALAASAFGIVGIRGYVHRVYATCEPVPLTPAGYPANPTKNDYLSAYPDDDERVKRRKPEAVVHELRFDGNAYEGCIRVEDGSEDDGNTWWTVWPREKHDTAKALLGWYAATYTQIWIEENEGPWVADETVPPGLPNKPKLLGGGN
ncbi:MAG: hypothetical protein U1E27_12565, partial [Kiritimatiellia bacterium]|nr:hypothetical protein [Kiritimatiellia bacterium]